MVELRECSPDDALLASVRVHAIAPRHIRVSPYPDGDRCKATPLISTILQKVRFCGSFFVLPMAEAQARHLRGILRMPLQCTLARIFPKLLERCGPPCAYIGISDRSCLGACAAAKLLFSSFRAFRAPPFKFCFTSETLSDVRCKVAFPLHCHYPIS